jgi:tryptophanyl-tRNA synthetase
MSKSRDNTLDVLAPPDELWAKLKGAVTDPQRLRRADPGRPEVCNVFSLHTHLSTAAEVEHVDRECRSAGIGCVDCKKLLHASLLRTLDPIRSRAAALYETPERVREILRKGGMRARDEARRTMAIVRERTGLRSDRA